jgi:hypothetical protein
MLDKAIALAAEKFQGVYDRGGRPYILHCLWVMDRVRHLGDDFMIIAVLHDIIEDTDVTVQDLIDMKFNPIVITAIDMLTKKPGQTYPEYIELVKGNYITKEIKLRDIEHNSKITRLKGIRDKDILRAKKYHEAYLYLKS